MALSQHREPRRYALNPPSCYRFLTYVWYVLYCYIRMPRMYNDISIVKEVSSHTLFQITRISVTADSSAWSAVFVTLRAGPSLGDVIHILPHFGLSNQALFDQTVSEWCLVKKTGQCFIYLSLWLFWEGFLPTSDQRPWFWLSKPIGLNLRPWSLIILDNLVSLQ